MTHFTDFRRIFALRYTVSLSAVCLLIVAAPAVGVPQDALPPPAAKEQRAGWDAASRAALLAALADRARHGLDKINFLENAEDASDSALRDAALRYARALGQGVVNPTAQHDPYTLARNEQNLAPGLDAALDSGTLGQWLSELEPHDRDYARLSQAYVDLRQIQSGTEVKQIGDGLLKTGDRDARVPAIVEQLLARHYLFAVPEGDLKTYSAPIADAVAAMQRDYGIAADGVVGSDTLGVLNTSATDSARAIAVALERRRWLERTPPPTRIDVNTAAATLSYYRDNKLIDTRRVVVGKPGTETPPLQSPIYRLVANPTWTVPRSIQYGELATVGADYFQRNNMELRGGWIVQRPGPDNALGLVKFDMLNGQAIYLHDTAKPELFARSERHRSHGCVRVEDALGFAHMLANDQGISEAWQTAQAAGEQQFVPLQTRIPVRLIYRNVFVDETGSIAFRTDPYDWNAPIAKALGFDNEPLAKHEQNIEDTDIGP